MNKPKWGEKRQCQECGAHFYDLKRSKVVCPKCNAPHTSDAQPKARRAIATPAKADVPAPVVDVVEKRKDTEENTEIQALKEFNVEVPGDDSLAADKNDDDDETAFEDASELGEDEDDMAEVIDGSRKIDET